MLPAAAAGVSVADARLNLYYPSGSDNGSSPRIQDQRPQSTHNTTESDQSEEDHDGIATAMSSIDLDGEGSSGNGNDDDNQDQVNQSSSRSSSSLPTDEESDENWESLEYVRYEGKLKLEF